MSGPVSDPKHVAAMLVGEMDPHGSHAEGGSEDSAEGGETDEGESAAADEVMQAMQSNDPKAFASALKAFIQICTSGGY